MPPAVPAADMTISSTIWPSLRSRMLSTGRSVLVLEARDRVGPGPQPHPPQMHLMWKNLPGDLPDGFGIARSGRIYVANAGLSAQIVVLAPGGSETGRFPRNSVTSENGSRVPFDTPSSATFLGHRILVAQSYLGSGDNHAILDVEGQGAWRAGVHPEDGRRR